MGYQNDRAICANILSHHASCSINNEGNREWYIDQSEPFAFRYAHVCNTEASEILKWPRDLRKHFETLCVSIGQQRGWPGGINWPFPCCYAYESNNGAHFTGHRVRWVTGHSMVEAGSRLILRASTFCTAGVVCALIGRLGVDFFS